MIEDEAVTLAKLEHGTSSNNGKFLMANNGADPTFETVTGTTINNNANNRLITGSGTANTLEGESTATYDGTKLFLSGGSGSSQHVNMLELKHLNTASSSGNGDGPALLLNGYYSSNEWALAKIAAVNAGGAYGGGYGGGLQFWVHPANGTQTASVIKGAEIIGNNGGADLYITDGDIKFASGHGIDFSATANGGTGTPSELLDDYEEGYFAPEITNLSSGYGSGTFYNRQARYTKIGNMVNCWVHIQFWGVASTSGSDNLELTVTGFPFEVDGVGYSGGCGGGLQSQSWRYSGSGWNNYATTSDNVQPRINSNEQIRFGVFAHNSITGQVTQKSINGYSPNIEFVFTVRVSAYK